MPYYWDRTALRYRGPNGQFISRLTMVEQRGRLVSDTAKILDNLTEQLKRREITIAEWQVQIKDALRKGHTLATAMAGGGKDNITPAQWGRVGQKLRMQYEALNRYASRIESGEAPIHRGWIRMYANAIRSTFLNAEKMEQMEAGYQFGQWVRTAQESCEGCIEQESLGVRPLDDIPDIGDQDCLQNCKCYIQLVNQ